MKDFLEEYSLEFDLALVSEYEIQVQTHASNEAGPLSEVVRVVTPDGVPSTPIDFRIVVATIDEIVVAWGPPVSTNGVLRGYLFVGVMTSFICSAPIYPFSGLFRSQQFHIPSCSCLGIH